MELLLGFAIFTLLFLQVFLFSFKKKTVLAMAGVEPRIEEKMKKVVDSIEGVSFWALVLKMLLLFFFIAY